MLDNDTNKVLSLGVSRENFDNAFNTMSIKEDGNEVEYLGGILTVTFEENIAIRIECDGSTNRFSFYNFNFGMDISVIEG